MLGIFLSGLWTLIVLYFNAIFPLKAVYFSTAFVIIGGGVPLLLPLLHAAAADAAPEEIRLVSRIPMVSLRVGPHRLAGQRLSFICQSYLSSPSSTLLFLEARS
jgi:hypothetical protein